MSEAVYMSRMPVFYDMQYTNNDGRLTPDAFLFNEQAFKTVDAVVNQHIEGLRLPKLSDTEIANQVADANVPDGTIWYDETNDLVKVKVAGLEKTVTVT